MEENAIKYNKKTMFFSHSSRNDSVFKMLVKSHVVSCSYSNSLIAVNLTSGDRAVIARTSDYALAMAIIGRFNKWLESDGDGSELDSVLMKVTSDNVKPTRGTDGSAGYDLRADIEEDEVTINPGEKKMISTGIRLGVYNQNYCVKIQPRSGLGRAGLVLSNTIGLIDSDYTGPVLAAVENRGKEPIVIKRHDRFIQMTFERVEHPRIEYVEEIPETVRGDGGFGHTGVSGNK